MKTRITITILGALLSSALVSSASASTWQTCAGGGNVKWASNSVTLRGGSVSFPSGSSWTNALQSVVSSWSSTPSNMNYGLTLGDTSVALGNGENETWWTNSLGAPAICYTWWNGSCQLVEADVLFLNTVSYSTSTTKTDLSPYGGGFRPFQTTAMHELGHAQGLGHTADTYSIMGQDWDHIHANGSVATAYPGEDAVAGSVGVYGLTGGGFEDLAVAHWRYTGNSGAYSAHDRTRMYNNSGGLLTNLGGAEPLYQVKPSQQVQLEMSYENLGKSNQTVKVGYYLSTNDFISTGDTFLGWQSYTLGRNTVYTVNSMLLTIPSWVTPNATYWVGAYIDYDGTLSETTSSNNAAYTAIKIEQSPPDMIANAISGPSKLKKNNSYTLSLDMSKVNYAGSYTFEIRLSKNNIISSSDLLIATGNSSSNGAQPFQFQMPKVKKGKYFYGLIIKNVVGEVISSNNTALGAKVKVKK